jgi:hypothetical protein
VITFDLHKRASRLSLLALLCRSSGTHLSLGAVHKLISVPPFILTINGVTVVGGLELDALAGSYSNNLALLDIGDGCPGLEVANGFGGFSSFYALSQFRTVVRSDARCSGWNERYLRHRKELVSLVRKNPRLAARIVKTAWATSPILTDGKNVLDRRGVEATTELAKELKQKASQELARDFEAFEKLLDRSAGAGLEDLIGRAAKLVKPTVRQKPQTDQTDAPRIRRKKLSRGGD